MEKKNNSRFINWMYWLTRIGILAHIFFLVTATGSLYSDYPTPKNSAFLVYGEFRLMKVQSSDKNYRLPDSIFQKKDSSINILTHPKDKVQQGLVLYKEKPTSYLPYLITTIDILGWWIWLLFTFLIMKIFSSLKKKIIFDPKNINRIRWIALVIGLAPAFKLINYFLFANLLHEILLTPGYYITYNFDYEVLSGVLYMILILGLAEIFKYGFNLQQENDLTI